MPASSAMPAVGDTFGMRDELSMPSEGKAERRLGTYVVSKQTTERGWRWRMPRCIGFLGRVWLLSHAFWPKNVPRWNSVNAIFTKHDKEACCCSKRRSFLGFSSNIKIFCIKLAVSETVFLCVEIEGFSPIFFFFFFFCTSKIV